LKHNRERFLLPRPTESIINLLASVARDWLDPEFPFRKLALENGPGQTGFTRETLSAGLDGFFAQITRENLKSLILRDLGSLRRLDELVSDEVELKSERASRAFGFPLVAHFTGGVLPNPVFTSMLLGLLSRSAQFFKCASGTAFLPRMFAHSLYIVEPKLGACIEIADWKGGVEHLDSALLAEADCVTATGNDETLNTLRQRLPARVRFLGYGHKVSFGYVAREMLSKLDLAATVASVADDVIAWNQLGCLSPHLIYVETGGPIAPLKFAEELSRELAEREKSEPRGKLPPESAASIATRRMVYTARASEGEHTRLWQSADSTAWTVVYEEDPQWQLSCLNRFVIVKPIPGLSEVLHAAAPVQHQLSTVGLAAPASRVREMAAEFSRFGATRICAAGQMQKPPLSWRHDGRPALGDLVTWSDFEF
jgi:hypothetical protein